MTRINKVTAKSKKCYRCEETKESKDFHINTAMKDGLNAYCKKCITQDSQESRGISNELDNQEESILLKYFPFAHDRTKFLCRIPDGATAEDSNPLTLSDIARENGITHGEVQRIFYKFTRLRLASLIVKGNDEGIIVTNVVYRLEEIREYIFDKYDKKGIT